MSQNVDGLIHFLVDRKLLIVSFLFVFNKEVASLGEHFFKEIWGYSSAGRAPALQAGGHRFEPDYLHQTFLKEGKKKHGLIAQLVRAHA